VSVECMALLGVQLRDDLSPSRKTAGRTSAITMRPGWLAQAAFVLWPPRSLRKNSGSRAAAPLSG
jgi:hypothetical protein